MKRYRVRLVEEATRDLLDIYSYIASHDSRTAGIAVLDKLERTCASLAEVPNRGNVPRELARVGVTSYREIFFKPYRIVYEVADRNVIIHCVLDGRRNLSELLERRLLR